METIMASPTSIICPSEEELGTMIEDYQCTVEGCGSVFKRWPNLRMHLAMHHKIGSLDNCNTGTLKFCCPVNTCVYSVNSPEKKSFRQRRLLKQHYLKVHAEKQFNCDKCKSTFSILSVYRRHIKRCGFKYICGVCNWEYNSNESLMVHLLRKHPEAHQKYIRSKQGVPSVAIIGTDTILTDQSLMKNNLIPVEVFLDTELDELYVSPHKESYQLAMDVVHCEYTNVEEVVDNNKEAVMSSNQDRFTQTIAKTVNKSTHSRSKKFNAETQTLDSNSVSAKTASRTNKSTKCDQKRKIKRTLATQTHNNEERNPKKVKNRHFGCQFGDGSLNNDSIDVTSADVLESKKQLPNFTNDISMDSKYTSNFANIETQTALDELLYSNLSKHSCSDDGSLFSDWIGISDIQTQTAWPLDVECFEDSLIANENELHEDLNSKYVDNENMFISTETQTHADPNYEDMLQIKNYLQSDQSPFNFKEVLMCRCFSELSKFSQYNLGTPSHTENCFRGLLNSSSDVLLSCSSSNTS